MKVLYFGKICDFELFQKKQKKEQPFFIAQYMYEQALCDNLAKEENIDLTMIGIHQTEYYPKDRFFFKRQVLNKNEEIKYVSFINLPIIRELSYFLSSILIILKWLYTNKQIEKKCIYSSCHFGPVSAAIVLIGKIFKVKRIVTFTDLPVFTYSKDKVNKMKMYKKVLMKPYLWIINYLQKQYDGYILFSKAMNNKVNPLNKKYCVIEGMYNSNGIEYAEAIEKKNIVIHAGTLNKEVGISKILDVFDELREENIKLVLIGKGDMVDEIKRRELKNKNIEYKGFVDKKVLFKYLQESKLLINLRNPEDEYTKYSFPSKMFEYMISGTPVLTTVLDGIPEEYYDYIYSVDSYDSQVISNKILDIMEEDETKLSELGNKAKDFIMTNKNSLQQTKKIIKFINNL